MHEEREVEDRLGIGRGEEADEEGEGQDSQRPRKRRRGGEIGRDWKCEIDGCDKDFKSVRYPFSLHHHSWVYSFHNV